MLDGSRALAEVRSAGAEAAVDRDHGAGHVARVVGEEERDHVGDLGRLGEAAHRDARVDLLAPPVLDLAVMSVST